MLSVLSPVQLQRHIQLAAPSTLMETTSTSTDFEIEQLYASTQVSKVPGYISRIRLAPKSNTESIGHPNTEPEVGPVRTEVFFSARSSTPFHARPKRILGKKLNQKKCSKVLCSVQSQDLASVEEKKIARSQACGFVPGQVI